MYFYFPCVQKILYNALNRDKIQLYICIYVYVYIDRQSWEYGSCHHMPILSSPGPVLCLLLGVSSAYAQPITGQVTEVTCPVIGWAHPELSPSKWQKTGPRCRYGWPYFSPQHPTDAPYLRMKCDHRCFRESKVSLRVYALNFSLLCWIQYCWKLSWCQSCRHCGHGCRGCHRWWQCWHHGDSRF